MFAQHGLYELKQSGDIIVFKSYGAWNLEASQDCIAKIKVMISRRPQHKFALLVDSREFEGSTPDAFDAWLEAIEFWFENGLACMCRVVDINSAQHKLFLNSADDIFRSRIVFDYAADQSSALAWLHQNGWKGFEDGVANHRLTSNFYS